MKKMRLETTSPFQGLAELVAEEMPDAYLSLSHQVLPKSPEFERISTTAVNAA